MLFCLENSYCFYTDLMEAGITLCTLSVMSTDHGVYFIWAHVFKSSLQYQRLGLGLFKLKIIIIKKSNNAYSDCFNLFEGELILRFSFPIFVIPKGKGSALKLYCTSCPLH